MLRSLAPVMIAAGVVDEEGEPKYALHAFRHFFASAGASTPRTAAGANCRPRWCSSLLGHSSHRHDARPSTATCFRAVTTAPSWRRARSQPRCVAPECDTDATWSENSSMKTMRSRRTVNPLAHAFVGSSPTSPTSLRSLSELRLGKPDVLASLRCAGVAQW